MISDKEFVEKIQKGDQSCWKAFVEQYTDWVLYIAWEFERKFCRQSAKFVNCGLLSIMCQRKGEQVALNNNVENCDEGMELYLWLFQQLKGRLKSYRGDSKLSTYIWTILNSKNLNVDILRWKYGRVDEHNEKRLPKAIQKLPKIERKIFILLRRKKDEEFIRCQLELDQENFRIAVIHVREALLRAGQMDLIERPELKDFEPLDAENEGIFLERGQTKQQEETTTARIFYNQMVDRVGSVLDGLKPAEQRLLKLYYHEGLSGKEIGQFCSGLTPSLDIDGVQIDSKNVYYLLGKITDRLISMLDFEIDDRKLSHKQWQEVLTIIGQKGLW